MSFKAILPIVERGVCLGIREQLDNADLPEYMQGIPDTLITASILSMAFMGFAGLV